jgi:hypothetical protein
MKISSTCPDRQIHCTHQQGKQDPRTLDPKKE